MVIFAFAIFAVVAAAISRFRVSWLFFLCYYFMVPTDAINRVNRPKRAPRPSREWFNQTCMNAQQQQVYVVCDLHFNQTTCSKKKLKNRSTICYLSKNQLSVSFFLLFVFLLCTGKLGKALPTPPFGN